MKYWKKLSQALFLGLVCLGTLSCTVVTEAYPGGLLTVDWYIEDDTLVDDCFDFGAEYLNLVVVDNFDDVVADEVAFCEEFTMTLELDPGRYYPEVTMLDAFERAITPTVGLSSVLVIDGEERIVDADFFFSDFF